MKVLVEGPCAGISRLAQLLPYARLNLCGCPEEQDGAWLSQECSVSLNLFSEGLVLASVLVSAAAWNLGFRLDYINAEWASIDCRACG